MKKVTQLIKDEEKKNNAKDKKRAKEKKDIKSSKAQIEQQIDKKIIISDKDYNNKQLEYHLLRVR